MPLGRRHENDVSFCASALGSGMKPKVSGGVAPTVITATVRIIREVSATAVKALPVRP